MRRLELPFAAARTGPWRVALWLSGELFGGHAALSLFVDVLAADVLARRLAGSTTGEHIGDTRAQGEGR
jgi:hypothetical protein